MNVSRREFLTAGGVLAASVLAPGRLLAALEAQKPAGATAPDLSSWSAVRAQFPLKKDLMHFSSFFLTSHPKPVAEAIDQFRRALDADPFVTVERGVFESEAENLQLRVLDDIGAYLDCGRDEIALTPNTTTGLALIYHGLPLKAGDEVLCTTHDHFVHHESIRLATERVGALTRRVALYDKPEEASTPVIVDRLRKAIRPVTRVVGVTWVHSSTGVRLPIRAIADALEQINAGRNAKDRVLLVVDGVHGLGSVDASVPELGCDYFSAGTHKWMFAPRGTGLVWAKPDRWARLRPTVPSMSTFASMEAWMKGVPMAAPTTAALVSPGGFIAFEHQWAVGAAFRFHRQIGRARIGERIRTLNDQCKAGLAAIPKVRLHTPRSPELSAGLVTFEVDGVPTAEVVKRLLEKKIVASSAPYAVSYARLAPSLVNDPAEVDAAIRAVREIAGA